MTNSFYLSALMVVGLTSNLTCVLAFTVTRQYRRFPAFTTFLVNSLLANILGLLFQDRPTAYWRIFVLFTALGYICDLAVMLEFLVKVVPRSTLNSIVAARSIFIVTLGVFAALCITLASSVTFADSLPEAEQLLKVDLGFQLFKLLGVSGLSYLSATLVTWNDSLLRKLIVNICWFSAVAVAIRSVQQFGNRLPHSQRWFSICDLISLITWSALMFIISAQLAFLKKPRVAFSPVKSRHQAGLLR